MSSQLPTQPEAELPISPGGAEAQGFVPFDPSSGEAHETKTPQILRYLAAVRRHRWLVLGVTLLGGVLGLAASRFVKPTYRAQSTLWVEQSGQDKQGPIQTDQLLESSGWRDLLFSYVVLDHVVSEERLFIHTDPPSDHKAFAKFKLQPRFIPGDYRLEVSSDGRTFTLSSNGAVLEQGRVGEPVGRKTGFDWTPTAKILQPKRVLDFEVVNPRDVSVELASQINATPPQKGGNFMRLSLAGTDATEISHTLNAVADRYVSVAADLKRAKLVQLTDLLEDQLEYAAQNLRDSESALKTFQIQTITLPSDQGTPVAPGLQSTQAPVMSRYFEMKVQRDQLGQDREAIERILAGAQSSPAVLDGLVMVPSVQNAPALRSALTERDKARADLRAKLERYTPEYKDVKEANANLQTLEQQTIPQLARELMSQLAARESEFDSTIGSASTELREIPPRAIEEARLVRQVATAENLHKMLKSRYEEARLAAVSSIPDIRILDRAVVPFRPVQDQRTTLIALGFLGSFGLALVGVILVDRIDPRVRYPEEITGGMGLAILGAIPNVKHLESPGGKNETTTHAAEAFRELRLNLIYAHGTAGPLLLTITSPGTGDGKSFTTSNLALAFADQGYRTLVIDGDIRRGSLHRTLGGRRAPGLTDFLAGEATKEEVLQSTGFPNISFIGAGTRMARGPELLGSAAMSRLLLDVRGQFDAILVDSAPLGAGVDAFALGTHTRNLLLVVRTGATDRALAQAKLELLDRLPIRLLGAVMNGTPSDSGIYRYYSYLPGYEVEEEKGAEEEKSTEEALQLGPG